ncbi:MAG: terpene cyclase/mutase family protein [Planctomycetia bacterium]|nr:terpene cyclase/mutase family protein [Planctomycetia bacterium]
MKLGELLRTTLPTPQELTKSLALWMRANGKFWGVSVGMHVLVLLVLGVAVGAPTAKRLLQEAIYLESEVDTVIEEPPLSRFDITQAPLETAVLSTESLTDLPLAGEMNAEVNEIASVDIVDSQDAVSNRVAPFGTSNSFTLSDLGSGPAVKVGTVDGITGERSGKSSSNSLENRSRGKESGIAGYGGTKQTEVAVANGLRWLARHQNQDGGWGCASFEKQCQDPSCSAHRGAADAPDYPMAATAFGLLPYLASGQTHNSKGQYQRVVFNGLRWMTAHQDPPTGRLGSTMYEHGLATIAICEAYGLSRDPKLKDAAQLAVRYIQQTQHSEGGWRYGPNQPGDVSVVGWQMMALKSAQMAGLVVNKPTLEKGQRFLQSCAKGKSGGLFSYMPDGAPTPTMSAVGLLCNQYSGTKRSDPAMTEGMSHVLENLPAAQKNAYFMYYATQVMHNLPGPEWDQWNRAARRMLITSQLKEGCAAGSWSNEGQAHSAGPLMVSSIHTLTLEVYYRYLPLYQIVKEASPKTE